MSDNNRFQLHDAFAKNQLKDIRVARDVLKHNLPAEVTQTIDWASLKLTDGHFVPKELSQFYSDVLYQCQMSGEVGYLYLLVEHKSSASRLTPFQLWRNVMLALDPYFKDNQDERLPNIIPVCLYHGQKSPYPCSTSLYDCFQDPNLIRQLGLGECYLIDLTTKDDDDIKRDQKGAIMERVLRDYHRKEAYTIVKELLSQHFWKKLLQELDDSSNYYLKSVFNYLIATDKTTSITEQNLLQLVQEQLPDKEDMIMNLAEQWQQQGIQKGMQEGMQKGMQKGRQEGKQEGKQETAKLMLIRGMSHQVIQDVTGLTAQEIERLQENIEGE